MSMWKILQNVHRLTSTRKTLRNNATRPEQELWKQLRWKQLGVKFRRQHSVGRYILDFYSPEKKLCIEIDWESHFSEEAQEYDEIRTEYLKSLWIRVIRFTNIDVMDNIEGVLYKIKEYVC